MPTPCRTTSTFALVALLALAALAVGACGDGDGGSKLSPTRADRLRATLDGVEERVNSGDCAGAEAQVQTLEQQVTDLPRRTDTDLQNALADGAARLRQLVATECEAVNTGPTGTTDSGTTGTETVPEEQPQEENGQGKQKKDKGPKKEKGPKEVPPGQDGTQTDGTPNGSGGSGGGLGDPQSGGAAP